MTIDFSHDYMEQCPYCKKYLLASQIKQHICNTPLLDVKEIPVLFSYETSNDDGEKVIMARGFDGVLYRLVSCKNPLKLHSSDGSYHDDEPDDKLPEPCAALSKVL